MIERCIVCYSKFVEQEKAERFPQLCGNCMQKELEAIKHPEASDCELGGHSDVHTVLRRITLRGKARSLQGEG